MENPKCFLSYSWDSDDHREWVRGLAHALQKAGIFVHLDRWDVRPGMDITRYMEQCIRKSDSVLLICTPKFAEKADNGLGGVGYEKSIVTGEIFGSRSGDTKFVPILRAGTASTALPSYLQSRYFLDFRSDEQFSRQLEELLRHLHGEYVDVRPPIGSKPFFGPSGSLGDGAAAVQPSKSRADGEANLVETINGLRQEVPKALELEQRYHNEVSGLSLRGITAKIREGATKKVPFGNTIKFATNQGVVYIDGNANPPSVSNDDKAADCTLKMDFSDFADLIGGKLDGMTAFMTGKLRIEGDMGVAMKLQTILR